MSENGNEALPAAPAARRSDRLLGWLVLLLAVSGVGYSALRVAGARSEESAPAGDIAVVSEGEPVDLKAKAVPGKYTLFDFYADWCPPCRALEPQLRELAARHDNLAVRKIDVQDWSSPVIAQQKIEGLPHMVLFGPDGVQIAAGDDVYPHVLRLFQHELY